LTTEHGLPINEVNSVIGDGLGSLWVGHDHGIYRVRRRALLDVVEGRTNRVHCVIYGEQDGLFDVENNGQISQPPSTRLRDGRLAFVTVAGLALVDPAHPPDLTNAPQARVERLDVAGVARHEAPPGGRRLALEMAPRPIAPVRIPPGEGRSLEFVFTAPSFRGVEGTRFRYRLAGLQPEWVEAGAERRAGYAYVPPGDYTFEVVAVNRHGYSNPHAALLPVRVEPWWYERTSVRAAGVLVVILVVVGGVTWRIRELRHLHQLEEEAARSQERTRLARDLHDGLGANLTELTLLSSVGEARSVPPEEMARRLNRLSETTHTTLHALRELIWITNPKADSLEALAVRVCHHAEQRLRSANVRCRLELPEELPSVPVSGEIRRELIMATNEIVLNAVRHAAANLVHLRMRTEDGMLVIEIEDDGRGFDPTAKAQRTADGSRGVGLESVAHRMASLGGSCDFRSAPGRGTCVTLRLPLAGR
jgi:signal transduction histidine kinase